MPPHPSLSPQCLPEQTGAHVASDAAASGAVASDVVASGVKSGPSDETDWMSLPASGVTARPSEPAGTSTTPASTARTGPTSTAVAGLSTAESGVRPGPTSTATAGLSTLVSGVTTGPSRCKKTSGLASGGGTWGRSTATEGPSGLFGVASVLLLLLPLQPTTTSGATKNKRVSER